MRLTRRDMLRLTAVGYASLIWPSLRPAFAQQANTEVPRPITSAGFSYLNSAEIDFVKAAVARLIPRDELGPGALEAGVVFFIDRQLAGRFGQAETWYMKEPWRQGTDEQGYQYRYTPAELYRVSIAAIDEYCQKHYGGKKFAQLPTDHQDRVLHDLDDGKIALNTGTGKDFTEMLWQNTTEGFFSDPVYGGNRDFIGWKLIGFPGPRYNYVNEIDQYGKRYQLPTVGLYGRDHPSGRKG